MQEQVWLGILRRVPVAYHSGLVLATVTGADLVLQSIIRLEENCLIFKGRPSGTNEAGKLMVVPYAQLNYIFFPGRITEQQMHAIFGEGDTNFAALPADVAAPAEAETPAATVDEPASTTEAPPPETVPEPGVRPPQQSKSLLLAKLRAKLGGDGVRPIKR